MAREKRSIYAEHRSDDPDEVMRRLELTVTVPIDRLLASQGVLIKGPGIESGDVRRYVEGDDVRRIDWSATARTQVTHIREPMTEEELDVWILFDLSPSLDFGTQLCTKRDLALSAGAAMGFHAIRSGRRLGGLVLTNQGLVTVPARMGRDHFRGMLRKAITAPVGAGGGPTDLEVGLKPMIASGYRRFIAVVVSDFLTTVPWKKMIQVVGMRHQLIAIEVVDQRELELPSVGTLTVTNPETGRTREIKTGSAKLRQKYAEAAHEQRVEISKTLRVSGAEHLVLNTARDWLQDLMTFVAMSRHREHFKPGEAIGGDFV